MDIELNSGELQKIILNDKYRLVKHLSNGGFGNVYLATCMHTNKTVVVKMEEMPHKKEESVLTHEVNILHYLHKNKCKNIPLIHWFGSCLNNSLLSIVMPMYIANVHDLYKNSANLEYPSINDHVFAIINKIGKTLEHIHKCGVIHRDIKPQNIMFKENGDPVLIDFGLSCFYVDANSGKHMEEKAENNMIGSLKYISLNVHKKNTPSRRDDFISLFYVALFMYCGSSFISQIWDFVFVGRSLDWKKEMVVRIENALILMNEHVKNVYNIKLDTNQLYHQRFTHLKNSNNIDGKHNMSMSIDTASSYCDKGCELYNCQIDKQCVYCGRKWTVEKIQIVCKWIYSMDLFLKKKWGGQYGKLQDGRIQHGTMQDGNKNSNTEYDMNNNWVYCMMNWTYALNFKDNPKWSLYIENKVFT
jgi:serine/threonine protein kinase